LKNFNPSSIYTQWLRDVSSEMFPKVKKAKHDLSVIGAELLKGKNLMRE